MTRDVARDAADRGALETALGMGADRQGEWQGEETSREDACFHDAVPRVDVALTVASAAPRRIQPRSARVVSAG
jgi:hypothetical protein